MRIKSHYYEWATPVTGWERERQLRRQGRLDGRSYDNMTLVNGGSFIPEAERLYSLKLINDACQRFGTAYEGGFFYSPPWLSSASASSRTLINANPRLR